MKKTSIIKLALAFFLLTLCGNGLAADDATKNDISSGAIKIQKNGFYSGTVKVSEIGKSETVQVPAPLVRKKEQKTALRSWPIHKGGSINVATIGNGVKIYSSVPRSHSQSSSSPQKGEWIRLGASFSGAKTIAELIPQVCAKINIPAVLADNDLNEAEARKLPVGYGVFIRHAYLRDKYKFSLEKLVVAYDKISTLEAELKAVRERIAGNVDQTAVTELEKVQAQLSEKTKEIAELNGELCLRDEKIAALEKENAELKNEIVKLKADLKNELKVERDKRATFAKEVRTALDGFLKRLDELEK